MGNRTIKRTTSPAGRRPKVASEKEGTRTAVLKASRTVFARRGFEGASTREVADVAGVNNAMIYYHFKDKNELYRAVLADSFMAFEHIWEHKVFRSGASAREKIRKYVEEFIRFQHSNEELRRIMSMEFAACSDNYKWLADNYFSESYKKLAGILKDGMRSGELRRFDPSLAIPSMVGMILHSFIMRPIAGRVIGKKLELSVPKFSRFVTGLFFDGLSVKTLPSKGGHR